MRRRGVVPTPAGVIAAGEVNAMTHTIPRSKSRKVNGYVKALLALEAARRKSEERYDRFVRSLDHKRVASAGTPISTPDTKATARQCHPERVLGSSTS